MSRLNNMKVQVDIGEDADAEELAVITGQLREEILDADVETADLAREGQAPPHTKAIEAMDFGTIVVGLTASAELLTSMVNLVQSWISRSGVRSVKLELDEDILEVTGISSRKQQELIDLWIEQHTGDR